VIVDQQEARRRDGQATVHALQESELDESRSEPAIEGASPCNTTERVALDMGEQYLDRSVSFGIADHAIIAVSVRCAGAADVDRRRSRERYDVEVFAFFEDRFHLDTDRLLDACRAQR
jgi:hypothetical protein